MPLFFGYTAQVCRTLVAQPGIEPTAPAVEVQSLNSWFARKNINHLRYADDTTLMVENEEELKSIFMKVKVENEKVGLTLNIQKMKIMASGSITSWEIDVETVETVSDYFWGLQNHCRW